MAPTYHETARERRSSAGFTMIEILVTLFVIAIGVLGVAGMQASALKIGHSGQLRSQAVILGLDILERIEANNPAAIAGSYAPGALPATSPKDCDLEYCTPGELAAYDLAQFVQRVQAQLPGSSASITFAGAGPYTYTIQINWEERIAKSPTTTVQTTGATNVDASGQIERFSYTVSKTYPDRAIVV